MHEPPRILVVDDNPNNVDILKTRLERHGYEIVTAADGEAALVRAAADAPDLILLDVMMPGVAGERRRVHADRHHHGKIRRERRDRGPRRRRR